MLTVVKRSILSGEYTRSSDRRTEGDQLANFKLGEGDYGGLPVGQMMVLTLQFKLRHTPNDWSI